METELGDTTLYTIQYADDQVVVAQNKENLQYPSQKLKDEYLKWGLQLNIKKTQDLCIFSNKMENLKGFKDTYIQEEVSKTTYPTKLQK